MVPHTWSARKQLAPRNHPAVLDMKRWNSLLRAEGLVLMEVLQGQGIAATIVSKCSTDRTFSEGPEKASAEHISRYFHGNGDAQ
jgi:hypothetical protein